MSRLPFYRCQLLLSLLTVGVLQRLGPAARAEEPRWFKLDGMPQATVGLEVDSSTEQIHNSGGNSSYDHTAITPTVGLATKGSVYHPNLLNFDLAGELGWGWDQMTTTVPGASRTRNESMALNRYMAQVNILENKPYNATVFGSQDHAYRDYGSFDTFTVDSTRYGGRMGWHNAGLSLNADFGRRDETATGLSSSSQYIEDYFNFTGMDQRQNGQTTLNGRINWYDNIQNSSSHWTSLNEVVGLSDTETFGHRKQITETTGIGYSQSDYSGQVTRTVSANENVNVNHRPDLDSYLQVDYNHNELDSLKDTRIHGVLGVRHQLYESLTSELDVHGNHQVDSGDSNSGTSDRHGVSWMENYTKRLQSWGRLTIGGNVIADHQEDNFSGTSATIIGENHQLYLTTSAGYHPVYLNTPQVSAIISVFAGSLPLTLGSDYQVITSGDLTEIQLLPSSLVLPLLGADQSLSVSVTYRSDSPGTATYDMVETSLQVRLDLFDQFGIYGRMGWMDNNASEAVLVQTLTDWVAGMDYHWRWFRTGAEYEDYDSNFSQYQSLRFFQNLDFKLSDRSTLGVSFNESFYRYPGQSDQTRYQLLTRYNTRLWSSLGWYVEGGGSLQDVRGTEETQGSARTGFTWARGKLSVRTGYEYNAYSTTTGGWTEDRNRHRFFAYLKRTF